MNAYKVKILQPNNWRRFPIGRLDVSVGMPNFEGEKLQATMQWAKGKFTHVIVSVADTLQRHNYLAKGVGLENAYNLSYKNGTDWIDRNAESLANTTIIRWDTRLNHPLYMQYLKKTQDHLNDDSALYDALINEAQAYAARKGLDVTNDRISYLIEEIAVFDLMFRVEPAADIYPGSILPFWEHKPYQDKAAFTRIDCIRRKPSASLYNKSS
jgi:tRNA-dependent cyclodipeptide synthase